MRITNLLSRFPSVDSIQRTEKKASCKVGAVSKKSLSDGDIRVKRQRESTSDERSYKVILQDFARDFSDGMLTDQPNAMFQFSETFKEKLSHVKSDTSFGYDQKQLNARCQDTGLVGDHLSLIISILDKWVANVDSSPRSKLDYNTVAADALNIRLAVNKLGVVMPISPNRLP